MERLVNLWRLSKQKWFPKRRAAREPLIVVESKVQQQQAPRRNKLQVFLAICCDCIHQFIANGQKVREERIEEREDDPCMNLTLVPLFGLEMDMMKDRFAKLLLGEDLSGGGKGVSSALALSNALTNLVASVFGDQWKLEALPEERKARWRRGVGWLVSVTDYIVELVASQQKGKDGSHGNPNVARLVERREYFATISTDLSLLSLCKIMVTQQRKDLLTNIPALRKLDAMLLDTLDNFKNEQEYQYLSRDGDEYKKGAQRGDKTINVPPNGLSEESRLFLHNQKEAVNQVIKEAMAINAQILSGMEVPESYMETLPKNGKSSLGESIYRNITDVEFDPEEFMSTLDLTSEHKVVDLKNKIEASIVIWKRKLVQKDGKASWGLAVSTVKRGIFEERAETILLLLRHQYPGLPQSSLDTTKIQYNEDVGLAVMESCYSRVLESLASKVMSRIEDVLHVDLVTREARAKNSNKLSWAANAPAARTLLDFMGWGYEPAETQVK